jgi:hypothetical protein
MIQDMNTSMEIRMADELRRQLANAKAEYEKRLADALNA